MIVWKRKSNIKIYQFNIITRILSNIMNMKCKKKKILDKIRLLAYFCSPNMKENHNCI